MKLSGKAREVADQMIHAFQEGEIPKALAQVFIHRQVDCPARAWSWRNRLLLALAGHFDARGYRQWQEVDRQVKKGEKAAFILAPRYRKLKEDEEESSEAESSERSPSREDSRVLVGFVGVPVFGVDQTEGEPLPWMEEEAAFLDALPLIEVARGWGLDVTTFDPRGTGRLGFYRQEERIGLGVENLSTWAHELVHAADDRRGTLNPRSGQQLDNEVVAELGGAVLLECLGYTEESDRGGCWEYIRAHAEEHERSPLGVITELLERTCAAVELILRAAEETAAPHNA